VGQFIATQIELDVVVVDAVLPDLDGVQLIQRIRRLSPDALIVATAPAGHDWHAVSARAHEAGADFALSSLSAVTLGAVLRGRGRTERIAPHESH
jgi:DNA-binding response OmpR family regulator